MSKERKKFMFTKNKSPHLKSKFVRIPTRDGLELHGLFFEPDDKKTKNAIVHIHAWMGNFYENKFIDFIAKEAGLKGFAFLTCNNRGTGIITDLIKRKRTKFEYVRIGGSLENFEDCVKDIEAAINFLIYNGYQNIVLEGHSTGCQKITYYKFSTKDKRVCGLIELSPADDVAVAKRLLGNKYEKAMKIVKKMVKDGDTERAVPEWMAFYPLLSANTFLSVADPKSSSGKIFDYSGELKEIRNVDCPMLAVFGSEDKYQTGLEEKSEILKETAKSVTIKIFKDADHWFTNDEEKLARLISNWLLKKTSLDK